MPLATNFASSRRSRACRGCRYPNVVVSVRDRERLRRPTAAQRLREIDDRYPCVARRGDPQRLGGEKGPLRVEHLQVRRAAGLVADVGDLQRLGDVGAATEITWSPDSHVLGLTLRESEDDPGRIAVADLGTNTIRPLTDGTEHEEMIGLSSTSAYAAFFRWSPSSPPALWVVGADGADARLAMTLASDENLGPCPKVAWSPNAPVLAIANAPCAPS